MAPGRWRWKEPSDPALLSQLRLPLSPSLQWTVSLDYGGPRTLQVSVSRRTDPWALLSRGSGSEVRAGPRACIRRCSPGTPTSNQVKGPGSGGPDGIS